MKREMGILRAKWNTKLEIATRDAEHQERLSRDLEPQKAATTARSADMRPFDATVTRKVTMGSPQDAALRHRLSGIRAVIQSFETDLPAASPIARADIELLISFYKDAEQTAKNEIELHELTHGGIDARKRACAHPERYITNAPAPPTYIFNREPRGPRPTREERIALKKADLESELQKAEARSSELNKAIENWYLHALREWDKVIAIARTRWTNSQRFAIEQYGALKVHYEQMLGSQDRAAVPEHREREGITAAARAGKLPSGPAHDVTDLIGTARAEVDPVSGEKPLLKNLKYSSATKRAVLIALTKEPRSSDLQVWRSVDADGAVGLPKSWATAENDRSFERAYRNKAIRTKMEKTTTKVRADLRRNGFM
jgi:hypothetical protein